jgi:hypothetical protein
MSGRLGQKNHLLFDIETPLIDQFRIDNRSELDPTQPRQTTR